MAGAVSRLAEEPRTIRDMAARGEIPGAAKMRGLWSFDIAKLDELALARGRKFSELPVKPKVPRSWVYVIGYGNYVKIGFSGNFDRRLQQLHGGLPEKLSTYATFANATRKLEFRLHKRFRAHRLQGEWFKREGDLAAWIDAGCPK